MFENVIRSTGGNRFDNDQIFNFHQLNSIEEKELIDPSRAFLSVILPRQTTPFSLSLSNLAINYYIVISLYREEEGGIENVLRHCDILRRSFFFSRTEESPCHIGR